MLIQTNEREYKRALGEVQRIKQERDALRARCEQLMGLLSWHADEAAEQRSRADYSREQWMEVRDDLYQARTRVQELEALIETELGRIKVSGRGRADVVKDIRHEIAVTEQRAREAERRMEANQAELLRVQRQAAQTAQDNLDLRVENQHLHDRLEEANERMRRAGQVVGAEVARQPLVNAAIRLADAITALSDHLTGRVRGADQQALGQELETAARDYRYERGRS